MNSISRVVAVIAVALTASLDQANAADPVTGAAKDRMAVDKQGGTTPLPPGTIARPKGSIGGCTVAQLQTTDPVIGAGIDACLNKLVDDVINNKPMHFVSCTGSKVECCVRLSSQTLACTPISVRAGDPSKTGAPATGGVMTR